MILLLSILGVLLCLLIAERYMISAYVRSFKFRVHVNGTRGKSSVTSYIASGLLGSGQNIMSKVTGEKPVICHNGNRTELKRKGKARVQEQFSVMRKAYRNEIQILILECMSISPELQQLESSIFKPHIYILTNIKDDHREVMGPVTEEQVRSMCSAIPYNCTVVTTEKLHLDEIKRESEKRGSKVITPAKLSEDLLENLPSGFIADNVSLAIEVCGIIGVERELVINRIIGSLNNAESPLTTIKKDDKQLSFLNAFSANDVESAGNIVNYWKKKTDYSGTFSVVFNTRSDRPLRTVQFSEWLGGNSNSIEKLILTGTHTRLARNKLIKSGMDRSKIGIWRKDEIRIENLLTAMSSEALVVGLGNFAGAGQEIIDMIK
jgi:poly-gamma-glutamate synthase PgsB/CapB